MSAAIMAHARNSMHLPPSPPSEKPSAMHHGLSFFAMDNTAHALDMDMHASGSGMPVSQAMPIMSQGFCVDVDGANTTSPPGPGDDLMRIPRDNTHHGSMSYHNRHMSTGQRSDSSPEYMFGNLPQGCGSHGAHGTPTNRVSMSSVESGQTAMTDMTENSPGMDMVTTPLTMEESPFSGHSSLPHHHQQQQHHQQHSQSQHEKAMATERHTMESILSMFPGTRDVLKSAAVKQEQEERKKAGAGKPKRVRKRRSNSGIDEVDDRRRVQNRLSQRSYRERKENTIKTLTADLKDACAKLADAFTGLEQAKTALRDSEAAHADTKTRLAACEAMLSGVSPAAPAAGSTMASAMPSLAAIPAMPAMPNMPSMSNMSGMSDMSVSPDHASFGILPLGAGSAADMSPVGNGLLATPSLAHGGLGGFSQANAPFLTTPTVDAHDASSSIESFFSAFIPE